MFRGRDPQGSLFESSMLLTAEKRRRLAGTWAEAFRKSALPLIDEEPFRELYCADNGRPNKWVQVVIGVLILKEMFDLTDAEALYRLDFDLGWHLALGLEPDQAHCCQKTLHNFRVKLIAVEGDRLTFERITDKIIGALGIGVGRQRLDSTHIVSNIAALTRLGLFAATIRLFLNQAKKTAPEKFEAIAPSLRRRYLKDDGTDTSYDDARSSRARRRLDVCARDLWRLLSRFESDDDLSGLDSYGLMRRLFSEQCEVIEAAPAAEPDADDAAEDSAPVAVKPGQDVGSDSLQTPHDPDVTYSGHKGKGYEVQVVETFGNERKPEIITRVEVTPSCRSDAEAVIPTVEELDQRGLKPSEILADTAYGSTANAIECERRGVELVSPTAGRRAGSSPDDGINEGDFDIDIRARRNSVCPDGGVALAERRYVDTGRVEAVFYRGFCETCDKRDQCPVKIGANGRPVLVTSLETAVLKRRRRYEETAEFKERYAMRAGIEAANSELKRKHGLGKPRVRGAARVKLAVYFKALAANVKRLVNYVARPPKPAPAVT